MRKTQDNTPDALPELITADQLAHELGLRRPFLYSLVRENAIPCVKLGRSVRFDRAAVRRWIESGGASGNGSGS